MSTFNLHKAINLTKNVIGYEKIKEAIINSAIQSGYEVNSNTATEVTITAGQKVNGDPFTVIGECLSDIIGENHDEINGVLNENGFINGYVDGDVLPALDYMFFVVQIPNSLTYKILF